MHIEKKGVVILDWYFGEGMGTNSAGEKVKKRGKTLYYSILILNLGMHINATL